MQLRKATDRVAGHIAVGVLADSGVVLVPEPPAELTDPDREIEALIIPNPPTEHTLIERIAPSRIATFALDRRERVIVAVVMLAERSRHAGQIHRYDPPSIARVLEEGGDFWDALEVTGAIARGIRTIPDELLREADRLERLQRRLRPSHYLSHTYESVAWGVCPWLPKCPSGKH
ncbi:hypothetical protein GCM10009850_036040 [Nonomuraea monospora]|uniref:Uncharacterized protein n=2 Tax=Nonomuraea monospora TaxID=568818 RepID=A0ABN3CH92_9ACTN